MEFSLIKDLATLTNIPMEIWEKFIRVANKDIAQCMFETIKSQESSFSIDIGIGILYIKYEEDNILYKFIPNESLEKEVEKVITERHSPLIQIGTKQFVTRLNNTYKEFI